VECQRNKYPRIIFWIKLGAAMNEEIETEDVNVVEFAAVEIVEMEGESSKIYSPLIFLCYDPEAMTGPRFGLQIAHSDPYELLGDVVDWLGQMIPNMLKYATIFRDGEEPENVDLDSFMAQYYEDQEGDDDVELVVKSPLQMAEEVLERVEKGNLFIIKGNATKH